MDMTVLQFPRARIVREVPSQQLRASEPLDWLNAFFEQASVAPWYQEWVEKWYGGGNIK
jgi:hypothetical protein